MSFQLNIKSFNEEIINKFNDDFVFEESFNLMEGLM
jgi:hypothetical protein